MRSPARCVGMSHDVYHKYTWCLFGMLLPFLKEHTLWPQAQATFSAVQVSFS